MMQLLGKKIIQRESGSNGNKQVLFHRIDSNKEDQWKAMYHLKGQCHEDFAVLGQFWAKIIMNYRIIIESILSEG